MGSHQCQMAAVSASLANPPPPPMCHFFADNCVFLVSIIQFNQHMSGFYLYSKGICTGRKQLRTKNTWGDPFSLPRQPLRFPSTSPGDNQEAPDASALLSVFYYLHPRSISNCCANFILRISHNATSLQHFPSPER